MSPLTVDAAAAQEAHFTANGSLSSRNSFTWKGLNYTRKVKYLLKRHQHGAAYHISSASRPLCGMVLPNDTPLVPTKANGEEPVESQPAVEKQGNEQESRIWLWFWLREILFQVPLCLGHLLSQEISLIHYFHVNTCKCFSLMQHKRFHRFFFLPLNKISMKPCSSQEVCLCSVA